LNNSENLRNELKKFLSSIKILNVLINFDLLFIFGGVAILIINDFISLGNLIYTLGYYAFFLGVLFTYANRNYKFLYEGLFAYAAYNLLLFLQASIFSTYRIFSFYDLATCLIFGFLGFLTFKHSSTI
jgi:hypothetical protein